MPDKQALLIDVSLCVGCNACQGGCKTAHQLPEGEEKHLTLTAFTALSEHDGVFVRHMCQHCDVPTCVSVCPVGAFTKSAAGPVLYDAQKCIGCRYCMQACPFHVPRYEWRSTKPGIQKCDFCAPRLAQGLPTACTEACPTGATIGGTREEMLRQAATKLAAEPQKYVQKIYGKQDVGGTSMLYISHVPFEDLGFNTKLSQEPMPILTMNALSKVPNVVTVGSVLLAGIWWITDRRTEVAKHDHGAHDQKRGK